MVQSPVTLLRKRDKRKAVVTFSELLFDLIYVFAVTQLSHYLLHHLNWEGLIRETVMWLAVWLAWQHTIWVTNWFDPETKAIRILLFVIMVIGLFMAAAIPEAYEQRGFIFAGSYVSLQIGRTGYVLFLLRGRHSLSANFERIFGWFLISAFFWIYGAFLEGNFRLIYWIIAVFCDYMAPIVRFYLPFLGSSDAKKEWTIEGQHLMERCQLFVIIAYGETIAMIGSTLSDISDWNIYAIMAVIVAFIGNLAMWWIYFDASSEAGNRKIQKTENPGLLGLKYNFIHVILVGALIISAVGDRLVIVQPLGEITDGAAFILILGPIIYLIVNLVYKRVTCHHLPLSHLLAILFFIVSIPFVYNRSILAINTISMAIFVFIILFEIICPGQKCSSI